MNTAADKLNRRSALSRLMRADAELPDEIVPGDMSAAVHRGALVTGATGFLGRFVVRELLLRDDDEIVCLVRAESMLKARERLANSLKLAGIDLANHPQRLRVVAAAVDQAQFGLSEKDYRRLAHGVGRIYHCAADVNWVRGYRQLRPSNVFGTLEVIRFACTGFRKRILYSSTIAVCFANEGPHEIDERIDMLQHIERMPLPYAQSKCVSESLLRSASSRGLPVSIIRPALISGDSKTGVSNPDDLISALIQGCIVSGSAIDTDWQLDCVPVDHVAQVLVRLGEPGRPRWELLNLFNERGRHWREVVLWMNLYGYPIELVSHAQWMDRAFGRLCAGYSLFGYRRFFGAASVRVSGPAPYESYLEYRQDRVLNALTRETLDKLGLRPPALDAGLLERYLEHYVAAGLVPRASRVRGGGQGKSDGCGHLRRTMEGWLKSQELAFGHASEKSIVSHNGIFNEVASARVGGNIGIRRYKVQVVHQNSGGEETLDILLKTKPSDILMQDLLVEVATLCDPQLGALCERFKHDLGLAGCHERELALYELAEPPLRRHMPCAYGTCRGPDQKTWSIAMEYLDEAEALKIGVTRWCEDEVNSVLRGLACIHANYYARDDALTGMAWLKAPPGAVRMQEMMPFWTALAEHSAPYFDSWLDESVLPIQKTLIADLGNWWPEMQSMPATLVHNDCNPRNFVIRRNGNESIPLFFDWELATVDLPQRDAAELLCFMLPSNSGHTDLAAYLELHRRELEIAAGLSIDENDWLAGFMLSLHHLLINRLPLYTLMHRFRPQPFLPAVVRNWQKLYMLGKELVLQQRRPAPGEW